MITRTCESVDVEIPIWRIDISGLWRVYVSPVPIGWRVRRFTNADGGRVLRIGPILIVRGRRFVF